MGEEHIWEMKLELSNIIQTQCVFCGFQFMVCNGVTKDFLSPSKELNVYRLSCDQERLHILRATQLLGLNFSFLKGLFSCSSSAAGCCCCYLFLSSYLIQLSPPVWSMFRGIRGGPPPSTRANLYPASFPLAALQSRGICCCRYEEAFSKSSRVCRRHRTKRWIHCFPPPIMLYIFLFSILIFNESTAVHLLPYCCTVKSNCWVDQEG